MQLNVLTERPSVAYFSMEIALDPEIPTYAGGLGVLAGDILRSGADMEVPMVGVTLLHRKGYFQQELDGEGWQMETPDEWKPEKRLEALPVSVSVEIEGRPVRIRPWLFRVSGINGHTVPVLLLDTSLPENDPGDRALTDHLYGGDQRYRLRQEAVLGLGGAAVLQELGYDSRLTYHMNEGHSALLTLSLLEARLAEMGDRSIQERDIEAVRKKCVFTTHTPVPAGHDQFPRDLVLEVLGSERTAILQSSGCLLNSTLNMTYVGLRLSRYVNGVSMKHGEVSLDMFPGYPVQAITNGVHATTWTALPCARLYDRYVPGWRHDNRYLRYVINIPLPEIQGAHSANKRVLLQEVKRHSGVKLDPEAFTIGFARRATPYKRADLLLRDPVRLRRVAERAGPIQVIYAGKAHPRDGEGKLMIQRILAASRELGDDVRIVYLEDYDWALAKNLIAGTDLWLNTPRPPREASGTSGMKAACNGIPSLSILDGWWIEGHIEGVTGWAIQNGRHVPADESEEVGALYAKLENVVIPLFYRQPRAYAEVMRSAIALNASFFNTQRVVSQYVRNAYNIPGNGKPEFSTTAP
ncbi:MAG: alpha-glucan family phosphorylase [Gemmatimonadota bacterium]|nr:MAG: alpha-glucan family phosphorylase [Gemmatimonadota bacterium]